MPRTDIPIQYRLRWAGLALLLVAEAMNLLDSTIVQVAAPAIHADLAGPDSDIQWFSAAYTLPFAVLLVTGGRLGDIVGRKRVFLFGVTGFVVASACCALAPSAGVLIAARAVQGAAAALVIPQTFGLIRAMFDGGELSRALGSIGPVMGLAAVCGPVLGGVLTHADLFGSSWRSVFVVNVPLGVAVLAGGRLLRADRADHRPGLDLVGTSLVVLGIGLVVYPLIEGNTVGWPAWTWLMLAAGLAVLLVFGRQQRFARTPLVERSLFTGPAFPAALVASLLFFAVLNGLMVVVELELQLGRHADALVGGLTLLPWSCGMGIASMVAGRVLVPRFGGRVLFAGLAVLLAGVLATIAGWPLLVALAISGLGLGLFTTPFFTVALRPVRPHETGSAAGLLNAVQQLGGTLGVASLGTVFLRSLPMTGPQAAAQRADWLAVALLIATLAAAVLLNRRHE